MSSEVSDESSITAEWLESILQTYYSRQGRGGELLDVGSSDAEHPSASPASAPAESIYVRHFQVRPGCDEGDNLLSDLLAIDVTLSRNDKVDEEHLYLMAKLLSQDPFCRHFIIEAGFDVREIHFYTTLIPALDRFCRDKFQWPIPPCYYAKYRQGSDSILVLDNMKEVGFAMVDFNEGLSVAEASAAVTSMAQIHASVLAYRLREQIDLVEAFPFLFRPEAAAESYQQLLERGLPQLSSFLHTCDDPALHQVLAKLHKLRPKAKEIITDLLRPTSSIATLTHTDFWCNNLLFRTDPSGETQCTILDWQMVTYSRPTNDIALLMVTSVSGSTRQSMTQHILDIYWSQLTQRAKALGVDIEVQLQYTKNDLKREYEESLLLAILLGIGSVDLAIGQEETERRLCQVLIDLSNDNIF